MKKGFYKGLDGGHRNDYYRYFSKNLEYEAIGSKIEALKYTGCILFLMYEESPISFLIIGLIRKIFGRVTIVLVFNPFYGNFYSLSFIKSALAKMCDMLDLIHFVPIIPRCAYNRKGFGFRSHCMDPQFYDLDRLNLSLIKSKVQGQEFEYFDKNKLTVAILGTLNSGKEIEKFVKFASINRQKYNFIAAGKMEQFVECKLKDINVFVENTWLTESRYLELLLLSDMVWCYFSATYDQSSGTLGRVVQAGKVPILRTGSVAEKICISVGARYVTLNHNTEVCENGSRIEEGLIYIPKSMKIGSIVDQVCN